jgi:hypothetical protein
MVSFYAHIVANARMQITWEKQHTLKDTNHKTKERKNNLWQNYLFFFQPVQTWNISIPFSMELFISTIEIRNSSR